MPTQNDGGIGIWVHASLSIDNRGQVRVIMMIASMAKFSTIDNCILYAGMFVSYSQFAGYQQKARIAR